MSILAFSRDAVASFISIVRFAYFESFPLALQGTRDHIEKFHSDDPAMTRGRYISLRAIYISSHITQEHTRNCFLMTRCRLHH